MRNWTYILLSCALFLCKSEAANLLLADIKIPLDQVTGEPLLKDGIPRHIDNHDSGYLGMTVQLYVQAYLGHYHIFIQKDYRQKLMAQLKSTPNFTYKCII